jgi:hypothetical protein
MYIKPSEEAEIRFGDIFEAGWLFDAWLETDAARIGPFMAKGGHTGYGAHVARDQDSEFVLAHSNVPKAMLAVNDDCYLETVLVRHERGRVHLAPVFGLPQDPEERTELLNTSAFSRFPMPVHEDFSGGIAELRYATGVAIKSSDMAKELKNARSLRLDRDLSAHLEARWGAHTSRRGPVVAANTSEKLTVLLGSTGAHAATSAELKRLLSTTWSVEGAIADLVDDADEAARAGNSIDPDGLLEQIEVRLQTLAEALGDAQGATATSREIFA